MTHAADAALVVQTVSALLYIALGAWVLTLSPRRLQNTLLGAFAVFFGLRFAVLDLGLLFHLAERLTPLVNVVQGGFGTLAFAAFFGLAWALPERLGDRRLLATALLLGFGLATIRTILFFVIPTLAEGVVLPVWAVAPLFVLGFGFRDGALVLLALRAHPARDHEPGDVTQLALLSVAFGLFGAFVGGSNIVDVARNTASGGPADLTLYSVLALATWILAAGIWGWNMLRADEGTVRVHRTTMLALLGFVVAGAVYFVAFPGVDTSFNVMRGVTRTLGVGLIAYGVLRHDLAGLDEKVEFGVSKTTVAGVFVAVFFVVSEGAQVLFAGFAGSEFLGVLAAGALVFFLAPIQRAADELAARAVPGGAVPGAVDGAEARYRTAVEMALADGEVARDEERNLRELEEELGLSPTRAQEIREQVEDEASGGDD